MQQQPQLINNNVVQVVGPEPLPLTCTKCQKQIMTRINYDPSTKTHVMAGLLCLFLCWPIVWLPYCIKSCKDANHYCPNCNTFIGTYKR